MVGAGIIFCQIMQSSFAHPKFPNTPYEVCKRQWKFEPLFNILLKALVVGMSGLGVEKSG